MNKKGAFIGIFIILGILAMAIVAMYSEVNAATGGSFFNYGTCPTNQFATAITTITLDCASAIGGSTEAQASCSTGYFVTSESSDGSLSCGYPFTAYEGSGQIMQCSITSTSVVMAGLLTSLYKIQGTGNIFITLNVQMVTSGTSGLTTKYQLAYGTGSQPACGASATGTTVGGIFTYTSVSASQNIPITESAVITGLTLGSSYWFDFRIQDSSTATWKFGLPVSVSIIET